MTFEEILDQAVAMLQRRGRLTYGALKRQFQLDDEYLADLKAELIDGQRVAVDEDGKVLVWVGEGKQEPGNRGTGESEKRRPARQQLSAASCQLPVPSPSPPVPRLQPSGRQRTVPGKTCTGRTPRRWSF
jgi:hypothetical protein